MATIYQKKITRGNRLITRGLGGSAPSLLKQGYTTFIKDAFIKVIQLGQSGTKRAEKELKEIIIGARLIKVNKKPAESNIQGFAKAKLSESTFQAISSVEFLTSQIRDTWNKIKFTVKKL